MKTSAVLGFRPESFSPALDRNSLGVRIHFSHDQPVPKEWPSLQIAVTYRLEEAQVLGLGGKLPAEALVLCVVTGFQTFAANILGDAVLFEDDFRRADGHWHGHVNFRLSDHLQPVPGREYHVTVALGTWLSNTLHLPAGEP